MVGRRWASVGATVAVVAASLAGLTGPTTAAATAAPSGCPVPSAGVHYFAPGGGRTVALTFDDGPGPSTKAILSILMAKGVRATFFNLGVNMTDRPALVRAEARQGHTLGNHTWDHPVLSTLSATAQAREIDRSSAEQVSLVGTSPCLLRPPYGDYDATTLALAAARHLAVWNWSVDPEDWKAAGTPATSYWVRRIVSRAEAGVSQTHPVILLHNPTSGDASTVAALPTVIDFYRAHGYAFVDLLGNRGFAPYAPSGAPNPAAAVTSSGLHVFYRGAGGRIRERTRTAGIWGPERALGGSAVGGPAAVALDPSSVLLAITQPDGHVYVRTVRDTTAGAWAQLGGVVASRPALAVDRRTGTVTLAARRGDGTIAYRTRVAGRWGAWVGVGGQMRTAPAVAVTSTGTVLLAAAGANETFWTMRNPAPGRAWVRRTGSASADPALVPTPDGTGVVAVVRAATGAVWVRLASLDATAWQTWRSLGGVFASGPGATLNGNRIAVVARGTDGVLCLDVARYGATATGWGGWLGIPS